MKPYDPQWLVDYLVTVNDEGYTILTFNGLGFDFDILAEKSGRLENCKRLAALHLDMFFHIFCLQGYCPGLGAIAKGLGLAGKTEGMHGALAPEMWQRGEYGKVLEYVAQDVRTTLAVARFVDAWGSIQWTSKSGKSNSVEIGQWLTVQESLELPEPDTSWMLDPWPRTKFTGWLQ